MALHVFEKVGGHPALDFLNTIHDWTVEEPRDYLADLPDAIRFGESAGLLSHAEARRLARMNPASELERLRGLRASLASVSRAISEGKVPARTDLEALAAAQLESVHASRLRVTEGHLTREVEAGRAGVGLLRLRLLDSAIALLGSPRAEQLKTCPACGWFFLDVSKNQSRRWCSMQTCGSIAKARSYYWRTKKGKD